MYEYRVEWIGNPLEFEETVSERLNELGAEDWLLVALQDGMGIFVREKKGVAVKC